MGTATFPLREGHCLGVRKILAITLASFATLSPQLHGQWLQPHVTSLFPAGLSSGSEVEIAVQGADLDDLSGLMFSHPGLTATKSDGTLGKLRVKAAADVPAGLYEARAISRYGLSNARIIAVGSLPERQEAGGANSLATATELPLNTTFNGFIEVEQIDFFKIILQSGQRLFISCDTESIDSPLRPLITVFDTHGTERQRQRCVGTQSVLDFTAAETGTYSIGVEDILHQGGPAYTYRLTVRTGPQIDAVIPSAAVPGTTLQALLIGRGLPGGRVSQRYVLDGKPLEELEVDIAVPARAEPMVSILGGPSTIGRPTFAWRLASDRGKSNPVPLALVTGEVVGENGANSTPEKAQKLPALPCEVTGFLDQDWFEFTAQQAEPLWVEVMSDRLGQPTDPYFSVHHVTKKMDGTEEAKLITEGDDIATPTGVPERFGLFSRDAQARVLVEAGKTYRISLIDRIPKKGNQKSRPLAPRYRLSVSPERPDFQALAHCESAITGAKAIGTGSPVLRRNGSVMFSVTIMRQHQFNDPITLKAEGLPPGVTATEVMIPAGVSSGLFVLRASSEAAPWVGRFSLKAVSGTNKDMERRVHELTYRWNATELSWQSVKPRLGSDSLALAVVTDFPEPVAITTEAKTFETTLAGKVEIPLSFKRDAACKEVKGEWDVSLYGLPGQIAPRTEKLTGDVKEAKIMLDLAKKGGSFVPGQHFIYAFARPSVKWKPDEKGPEKNVRSLVVSAPISLNVLPSPVVLRLKAPSETLALVAPGKLDVTVLLERRHGFAESVELSLSQPPSGLSLGEAKQSVPKEAAEVNLTLSVAAEAKPGLQKVVLEAKCQWNGEELRSSCPISLEVKK